MAKKYLFVHQNFPGQFVHVASALAAQGNEVVALGIKGRPVNGVRFIRYGVPVPAQSSSIGMVKDFETKVARGIACAQAMDKLKQAGYVPDVVVAHPSWGEALFCKDVWPIAKLVVYSEFFYAAEGADYGFDPELFADSIMLRAGLRLKNSAHLLALEAADMVYTPTQWQRSKLPLAYQAKAQVMFDGIDTTNVAPNPRASIHLKRKGLRLGPGDEVLTFVNRSLEPYRGFHVFMRALPAIMARRPHAHCVIVGKDTVSYGAAPKDGRSWREVLLAEVGDQLRFDRVHFLGELPYPDYLRVLQVSTCHVYLTYPFVLSWSCLEAMSAGCVVVGSRTGPVEEVVQDGVNGHLVDFFDIPGLVDRVVSVLSDPAAHHDLAKAARADLVQKYDLSVTCLRGQLRIIESV